MTELLNNPETVALIVTLITIANRAAAHLFPTGMAKPEKEELKIQTVMLEGLQDQITTHATEDTRRFERIEKLLGPIAEANAMLMENAGINGPKGTLVKKQLREPLTPPPGEDEEDEDTKP